MQGGRPSGRDADDVELPMIADALSNLPPSLKVLDLQDVELAGDNFVTHSLKELRLRQCAFDFGEDGDDTEARYGLAHSVAISLGPGCTIGEIPGFPDSDDDDDGSDVVADDSE